MSYTWQRLDLEKDGEWRLRRVYRITGDMLALQDMERIRTGANHWVLLTESERCFIGMNERVGGDVILAFVIYKKEA